MSSYLLLLALLGNLLLNLLNDGLGSDWGNLSQDESTMRNVQSVRSIILLWFNAISPQSNASSCTNKISIKVGAGKVHVPHRVKGVIVSVALLELVKL